MVGVGVGVGVEIKGKTCLGKPWKCCDFLQNGVL